MLPDAGEPAPEFELLAEAADCWRLFLLCATQFRHAGMAGIATGLDYLAVEAVARMTGRIMDEEMLRGVQAAEVGALEGWEERRRRTAKRGAG